MAREADIRYSPLCKELKDVVCWEMEPGPEAKIIQIKILDRLIDEHNRIVKGSKRPVDGGNLSPSLGSSGDLPSVGGAFGDSGGAG